MKGIVALVAAVAAIAVLPGFVESYGLSFLVQTLIFVCLAYSWNLIGGYTGYAHFGQAGFFGLGANIGTIASLHAGTHWLVSALLAGVATAMVGLVFGSIMLRLRGPYFAIGMFGLARVWEAIAYGWDDLTLGGTGLMLPPAGVLTPFYYATAALALGSIAFTAWVDNSRFGLQLLSIREDEDAATALGIKSTRLKVIAFTLSTILPGVVGSIYAAYLSYIDPPTAFSPVIDLTTIAMVLLGGMGTLWGPLIGAALLTVVNEALWAEFPEMYLSLVGFAIGLAVLWMPRGVFMTAVKRGWLRPGRGWFRQLLPAKPGIPAAAE